jgi:hypothetical protein
MTLDDFIKLEKINLEKFRIRWARGVKDENWPTDFNYQSWLAQINTWKEMENVVYDQKK